MSRNPVQFQRGYSLSAFFDEYGTEAQCEEALFRWRWPNGFICPECGWHGYCALKCRRLFQCHRCHHQRSLTSGTVLASTKLPLRTWFLAMYLLTQTKNGISALELHRQLGGSYNTAWGMKHKLMQAMKERDDSQPLRGQLQVDDAYWGGERHGGKVGRGAPAKTPFVAAVETDEDGRPRKMRLTCVTGFRREAIAKWAVRHVQPDSVVTSDDLACFNGLTLLALTAEELRAVLEHGVSGNLNAGEDGLEPDGQFPQIAGVEFSYKPTNASGNRITNATVLIGGGNTETLVENGVTQDDVGPYRVVTLSFLAGGGDGYPFPTGASANRVDLAQPENAPRTGQFDFAPDGSEQDAFAEYLGENFPVDGSKGAFDDEETTPDKDERITNLDF